MNITPTLIRGVAYQLPCCQKNTTKTAETNKTQILKHKVQHAWNTVYLLIKINFTTPIQKLIQKEIDKIDIAQTTQQKPIFCSALRRAFATSMTAIKAAKMDPTNLPKQVALQLTEILGRFGIAIYANKDVQHPFQASLDVLKTALLMQKYALGLSNTCPDLSQLLIIDDLYNDQIVSKSIGQLADQAIDNLNPSTWSSKTLMLTEKQLLLIPNILRYTNGAMRYLEQATLPRTKLLLETGEACLLAAQKKPTFNQVEVNHQLAEFKYNEMTGFLASQIEDFETNGQLVQAEEAKQTLRQLWSDAIALSKDPEQMRARCDNKRTFIEKLSVEEKLELFKSALNRHLSLPKERQNIVLIALAHLNLSHTYVEMQQRDNAIKHAKESLQAAMDAKAQGENNVQFDNIINHVKNLIIK